jgi:hypothetical protein
MRANVKRAGADKIGAYVGTRSLPDEESLVAIDIDHILTKEKAQALCTKIADGLERDGITGSANVIGYAMREAWIAGFEEGRKHSPSKEEQ